MKKRPVLLLEVLLALLLLVICAVPLVKQPLKLYREEITYLEKMEKERLADWSFTEIKELLLKNGIPWEKLPEKDGSAGPFFLPDAKLDVPGCKNCVVKRRFMLTGRGAKEGMQGQLYRQLGVYIFLNDAKYEFRIAVQKLNI